ncbi:Cell adhesion molecule 3 [Cricetulus griseus]|uniref:Cell adhesion molecule 3 n=1 Tax=Cricetulus griseus TaxID=10029 RepID=G3H810_CRIGR|nr:Cell adhesion molecule 3 [Cricetulus griseus]
MSLATASSSTQAPGMSPATRSSSAHLPGVSLTTASSSAQVPGASLTTAFSSAQTTGMSPATVSSSFQGPRVSAAKAFSSAQAPKRMFLARPAKKPRLKTVPTQPSEVHGYHHDPKQVMVLKATEPFTYSTKSEKSMFHATVATETEFFRVKVFDISLKAKFIKSNVITISDYFGCNGFINIYSASSVSEVNVNQSMIISTALMQRANATPKINYLCSKRRGIFVNGIFMVYEKNVSKDCICYEIRDNTGMMEVVVYGRLTSVDCNPRDKLKLVCFELTSNEDKVQLRSTRHSNMEKPRLKTIPKRPSEEDGHQEGPKQVMVLKATEPFTYDMREDKTMFHATVATETEFFRVKVFDKVLKEKFIINNVIVISDYIGRNGFLEIHSASSVSEVNGKTVMNIPPSLRQRANATPKINTICTQRVGTFVNGVFAVYRKTVKNEFIYYGIEDKTGKMEVVVHGQFTNMYCEPGDKLRLFCFELSTSMDKWQLRSGRHSYLQKRKATSRSGDGEMTDKYEQGEKSLREMQTRAQMKRSSSSVCSAPDELTGFSRYSQPWTSDETVVAGGTVVLKCQVKDHEDSSLQWSNPAQQTLYFGEKRALRDNRIQLVSSTPHELSISISNVALADEGEYTCSIFTMPVRTAKSLVTVLGIPQKPIITGYKSSLREKETATLNCQSSGSKPAAQLTWRKGDQELHDSLHPLGAHRVMPPIPLTPQQHLSFTSTAKQQNPQQYLWVKEGSEPPLKMTQESALIFPFLNKSDSGTYGCTATSNMGSYTAYFTLNVNDPSPVPSSSSTYHAIIGGIVAFIVFLLLILLIFLGHYLIRHKGTYLTHEAKGSDDAPDADTAIINAEGGQSGGDDKKEYFI